jgi:predicted ABC-type ATPase
MEKELIFETVLSASDKIAFIERAKSNRDTHIPLQKLFFRQ